jgi:hypothetical protein
MRDRAFRRFQELKKKQWVQKLFSKHRARDLTDADVGVYAHTPALCSCYMCGNPRKWWDQKTIQEKKMDDFYKATDEDYE